MTTPFIETDCTITHDGNEYTAGGAVITDDHATAYLAIEVIPKPTYFRSGNVMWMKGHIGTDQWLGTLTDWHGSKVGTYHIVSTWQQGWTRMYSICGFINGRSYHGRTQGPGTCVYLTAHKNQ